MRRGGWSWVLNVCIPDARNKKRNWSSQCASVVWLCCLHATVGQRWIRSFCSLVIMGQSEVNTVTMYGCMVLCGREKLVFHGCLELVMACDGKHGHYSKLEAGPKPYLLEKTRWLNSLLDLGVEEVTSCILESREYISASPLHFH